jgi:membrane protein DedA with SNARE-associated domain
LPDDLNSALLTTFLFLVTAAIGNPTPEELVIAVAGIWTGAHPQHGPERWLMLPVIILGAVIADVLLYSVGWFFGPRLLERSWVKRLVPDEKRTRIEENFHRYGVVSLIIGRLIPGIRTALFLTAGVIRLPVPKFLLADVTGAVIGNSLIFLLGFWIGDQFKELITRLKHDVGNVAQPIIMLSVIGLLSSWLIVRFFRRPIPTGDPEEVPLIGHQIAVHLPDAERPANPPAPAEHIQPTQTGAPTEQIQPAHTGPPAEPKS